jgi:predicted PurR-regulated permease PerM
MAAFFTGWFILDSAIKTTSETLRHGDAGVCSRSVCRWFARRFRLPIITLLPVVTDNLPIFTSLTLMDLAAKFLVSLLNYTNDRIRRRLMIKRSSNAILPLLVSFVLGFYIRNLSTPFTSSAPRVAVERSQISTEVATRERSASNPWRPPYASGRKSIPNPHATG